MLFILENFSFSKSIVPGPLIEDLLCETLFNGQTLYKNLSFGRHVKQLFKTALKLIFFHNVHFN